MKIAESIYRAVACSQCGAALKRVWWNYGRNRPIAEFFCNNDCKGGWQRAQREAQGFTREWLIKQYITLGRSANEIARDIGRDSKRVWEWITDYGIPTRPRGSNAANLPKDGRSFRGKSHTRETRELIRQCRLKDGHVPYLKNGEHWLKSKGAIHPTSKGGITPERQALYASVEWASCVAAVWKRDDAICRRCGLDHRTIQRKALAFHIHHIDGFAIKDRRTAIDNLVLLCAPCHRWVHGAQNTERLFIGKGH